MKIKKLQKYLGKKVLCRTVWSDIKIEGKLTGIEGEFAIFDTKLGKNCIKTFNISNIENISYTKKHKKAKTKDVLKTLISYNKKHSKMMDKLGKV